jgi:hypothetical protein
MKSRHLLFIFLVILVLVSCKGKEDLPNYYVDAEILRYCWFPEGSYWIYQLDSSSTVFDSVYLSNGTRRLIEAESNDYFFESYAYTLNVSGQSRRQAISALPLDPSGESILSELVESYSNSSVKQYDYLLFEYSGGGETLGIHPSPFKTHHDSISIEGTTYFDALQVSVNPAQAADWTYDIIWVKDIGIARRSMRDGTTWNLIRYHINR